MRRLILAVALSLPLASARAERDALSSLVGMAGSAATDKGPEAGALPENGEAPREKPRTQDVAEVPAAESGRVRAEKPRAGAPAPALRAEASKEGGEPVVAAPSTAPPRVWTRFFASLVPPSHRRDSAFELFVSTAAARRPMLEVVRSTTPASAAGAAQGLAELVAATTAPAAP